MTCTNDLQVRRPTTDDAADILRLVNESGVLDANSLYAYLLLCRDFASTCRVAERNSEVVGFVTAYHPPQRMDVLFVWQVAVSPTAQGQGLGLHLLSDLVRHADAPPRYIEATVAPSNQVSRRLFRALASNFNVTLTDHPGFDETDFPSGDHEPEPVIRIGPLTLPSNL